MVRSLSRRSMRIVAVGRASSNGSALATELLLLLDEPLAALPSRSACNRGSPIGPLRLRPSTATLFVTYVQEEALSMTDRVGVIKDERLAQVAARQ
jgi:ABC-type sugar transport system ATPase subunit